VAENTLGHTQRAPAVGAPRRAKTPVSSKNMAQLSITSTSAAAPESIRSGVLKLGNENPQELPGSPERFAGSALSKVARRVQPVRRLTAGQGTVHSASRPSGGEKCNQPTLSHLAEARETARGARSSASGVWPNPSLSTDPLRQASLPVRRAGLCCTTRASRPASAGGVSSNVRPHEPTHVAPSAQR
jgi:hypothetical protein